MSVITEVLFLAVMVTVVFLVYTMALPIISSMQSSAVFEQTKSVMLKLDEKIQQTAAQGKGSRTSLYVTLGAGTMSLDEDNDDIKWTLETDSMIVSPRSMQKVGNLIVGSNLDVMAYDNGSYYVLENQHLIAKIKKIGSASSPAAYNTSELLMGLYNKELGAWMDLDRLEISISGNSESTNGTGYTEIVNEGRALPKGEVIAHINTNYVFLNNYTITFTLESGADFLTIEGEE